jgi:chromosome segregation ATPase
MLLNISFEELRDFFTIILWITIPIIVVASGIAAYFHFRKKRTNQFFSLAYAGSEGSTTVASKPDGSAGWQDHYDKSELMLLLKKYEQDIELHMDTQEQLKQEFNELEEQYIQLQKKIDKQPKGSADAAINKQLADANDAVSNLQAKLKEYESSMQFLEKELEDQRSNNNTSAPSPSGDVNQEVEEWKQLLEEQEKLMTQQQATFDKKEEELKQMSSQVQQLRTQIAQLEKSNSQLNSQSSQSLSQSAGKLAETEKKWAEDKEELTKKINLINSKLETVNKENEWLKEQAAKVNATPVEENTVSDEYRIKLEDLQLHYNRLEQENEAMKSKVTNQEYAEDLVNEKKLQIEFLQNQLEQRIKSFRELEAQNNGSKASIQLLEETSKKYEEDLTVTKQLLQAREKEFNHFKETTEKTIHSKVTHIELLEREISNLQLHTTTLQVSLDESGRTNQSITKELEGHTARIHDLEAKLETSNKLFSKIYGELSKTMDEPGSANGHATLNGTQHQNK